MLIAPRRIFSVAAASLLCSFLDEALPDYAKAYQYQPDDLRFAGAYAYALQMQKDYAKAEQVLQELLRQLRNLAARNPAAYRPDVADTLTTLGNLFRQTNRWPCGRTLRRPKSRLQAILEEGLSLPGGDTNPSSDRWIVPHYRHVLRRRLLAPDKRLHGRC
jgi:tetratricopeptide (TPR) repeat protein